MTEQEIQALVAAHPLPAGVPDAVLNKAGLKEFFGVSAPTIDAWVSAGMPALTEGTNGRSWEFQASQCWAWKQSRDADDVRQSEEAQAAIASMRIHMLGGKSGDSLMAMAPKDRQQLYAVQVTYEQLVRIRNETLDRDDVREGLEAIFSIVRDVLTSFPDRVERDASLAGKPIELLVGYCDDLLVEVERKIAAFFETRPLKEAAPMRSELFSQ